MNWNALITLAAGESGTPQQGGWQNWLVTGLMLVGVLVVGYFFIIRPQRKKDKETAKMRSELQVGDEIVTIGGIIGIIVSMKEDSLVIETGSDRSKVRLARWAISGKNTTAEPK